MNLKQNEVKPKKILIHDRRYDPRELESMVAHLEFYLPEGTQIQFNRDNCSPESAFEENYIPDVYAIGWNISMYSGDDSDVIKDINEVKERHPDIKVIAMPYDRSVQKYSLSKADSVVAFRELNKLTETIGKFIGTRAEKEMPLLLEQLNLTQGEFEEKGYTLDYHPQRTSVSKEDNYLGKLTKSGAEVNYVTDDINKPDFVTRTTQAIELFDWLKNKGISVREDPPRNDIVKTLENRIEEFRLLQERLKK